MSKSPVTKLDKLARGDWASLAWWIHAHVPEYISLYFFPNLCAFYVSWHVNPDQLKQISTYVTNTNTNHKKQILKAGTESDYYKSIPLGKRYTACEGLLNSNDD